MKYKAKGMLKDNQSKIAAKPKKIKLKEDKEEDVVYSKGANQAKDYKVLDRSKVSKSGEASARKKELAKLNQLKKSSAKGKK